MHQMKRCSALLVEKTGNLVKMALAVVLCLSGVVVNTGLKD